MKRRNPVGDAIVVLVTTASKEEAAQISAVLLERHLIACANLLDGVRSLFHWHGEVCKETETLMILKSTAARFADIESTIKRLHSYDVPEIIALPILDGSTDYLNWVQEETRAPDG